jgi:bacteriocin biosynthesis cyclodehydratase domain-containing protein
MAKQSAQNGPVHLLSVGTFGRAVGQSLRSLHEELEETVIAGDSIPNLEGWPISRVNVIVSCRPIPHLCGWLDRISYERRQPFIPVILDSGFLRVGPIVIPGESCWNCWMRRLEQHSDWPNEFSALMRFYSSYSGKGPQGYLEPFAMIGAAQIVENIRALEESSAIPGYVWQIDIIRREIITSRVIGIHDCPRCGLHRSPQTRNYLDMQADLSYLWRRSDLAQQIPGL